MPANNDTAGFGADDTLTLLHQVCATTGLDPGGAELIRLGENAVYGLRAEPVVVRIARSLQALGDAGKETRVARWLAGAGYPAVRLAALPGAGAPMIVAGHPVTLWHRESIGQRKPSSQDLAPLLRVLHELPTPTWLELPAFDPFDKIRRWLQAAPAAVDAGTLAYLTDLYHQLTEQFAGLSFVFPPGLGHGDAHPGNVLCTAAGVMLLHDFEAVSAGPGAREWDLTATAAYRYGFDWITAQAYERFVDEYGFDIAGWDGFPVLRAIRELAMVTWLMQLVGVHPRAGAEFTRRVEDLRSGALPRRWSSL